MKFTGKEIGCGTYGKVYEVGYEGRLYAAKEIHLLSSVSSSSTQHKFPQDSILNNLQIWSTLDHPCITRFIGQYTLPRVNNREESVWYRKYEPVKSYGFVQKVFIYDVYS